MGLQQSCYTALPNMDLTASVRFCPVTLYSFQQVSWAKSHDNILFPIAVVIIVVPTLSLLYLNVSIENRLCGKHINLGKCKM